ncbi:MAG: MBL fold metallo-hydrolase [Puniceicoccales bacterium]
MSYLEMPSLSDVSVTILCENTARGAGILGEHGLAWWIEAEGKTLLFDLGQGLSLAANAKRLGLHFTEIDAIVLSHGHYDHVGGWKSLPPETRAVPVYLHPDALLPKYQRRANGSISPAGHPSIARSIPQEASQTILRSEPTEVLHGIWMTGEVPRQNTFEDTGGDFVLDPEGSRKDPLNDDQSLFFRTSEGIVVILGCAHAGVINTLHYIERLTQSAIHAVIGGMHLLHASDERMKRTVEELRNIAPDWIGPNHCTGDSARAELHGAFQGRFLECHAGQRHLFPIPH